MTDKSTFKNSLYEKNTSLSSFHFLKMQQKKNVGSKKLASTQTFEP